MSTKSQASWPRKQKPNPRARSPREAGAGADSLTHKTIEYLQSKTDEVILFYSGGKDGLALCHLLSKKFKRVVCVFMYLVKDLEHIEPFLKYPTVRFGYQVMQVPHWMASHYYKDGVCRLDQIDTSKIKRLKIEDIIKAVRRLTQIEWVILGQKKSDSMVRNFYLKGLHMGSVDEKKHIAFPLSDWTNKEVLSYIKFNKMPAPIVYNPKGRSQGIDLTTPVILWLKQNHPNDLKKILQHYPLAEHILHSPNLKTSKSKLSKERTSKERSTIPAQ